MNGRSKEAMRIREANRAAAVGRLLLGRMANWQDFLAVDTLDLEAMPRRRLKSGNYDVQNRLVKEIDAFCSRNFTNMTTRKLAMLYEEIKSHRGLEIPLQRFEEDFSPIKPQALKGHPKHATLVLSLWGLQFMYPEHYFSADIRESLTNARSLSDKLQDYSRLPHARVKSNREKVAGLISGQQFSSRTCLLSCFNLLEAYFNGLAWEFSRDSHAVSTLSNTKRGRLEDTGGTKFRDKILKYPEIISGRFLWDGKQDPVKTLLEEIKPFRDSLVHPSPFTTPERFGGYDKLQTLYRLDVAVAQRCAKLTYEIITAVRMHLHGAQSTEPPWLTDLGTLLA